MTTVTIYPENDASTILFQSSDPETFVPRLAAVGVAFERWEASHELPPNATQEQVLAAYAQDVEKLKARSGYHTVDVVRLTPDNPNKDALRAKFLDEHTHGEDEIRFFVEGSGAFYLHLGSDVMQIICTRGDLLSVPSGTRHWYDMGPEPSFAAIRFFQTPDGWVASFTGDKISANMPKFETAA